MTTDELDERTAVFDSRGEAAAAAERAMPRRKHNRPYAQSSGYYWKLRGRDTLRDGSMYDYARKVTVRP